ncbi:MAG: flagellar biosynthetic protein FliR [Thermoguttaceae bacterium]|nr:flagellar biosynthetic protein FliR [Thermoguttaceae bacterium]MBR5243795.1 flagellar biosynthetic protein FliR [Thermoguttaceae bacterium]
MNAPTLWTSPTSWGIFALIFARCFGTTFFAPMIGGVEVSRSIRTAVALTLAASVFPTVADAAFETAISEPNGWATGGALRFGLALGVEVLFGAALGLALRCLFSGVSLAGETIARVGGISVAGTFDPTTGEEIAPISRFLFWLALVVFATAGGFELFIEGLLTGFANVEPGGSASASALIGDFAQVLTLSFSLAIKLAAPVLSATAAVYLAVGFLGRLLPQLNLFAVGFNVASLLTLSVLFLSIGAFCSIFQTEIVLFLRTIFRVASV